MTRDQANEIIAILNEERQFGIRTDICLDMLIAAVERAVTDVRWPQG